MIFSKIFKFFLILMLFCAVHNKLAAVTHKLSSQFFLEFTPTNELFASPVLEYVRELESINAKIFPVKSTSKKQPGFRIIFSDDIKNSMSVRKTSKAVYITLGGLSPSFQNDYQFLHNLFTAMTIKAIPNNGESIRQNWKIPHWIFMAEHAKIKSIFSGKKLFRSSKVIHGLSFYLIHDFFPDPLMLENYDGENSSGIELYLLQDYCRFIFELASAFSPPKKNYIGLYLNEIYLNSKSHDPALFQRIIIRPLQEQAKLHLQRIFDEPAQYSETKQLNIFLKFHADLLAFSFTNHAPAKYLRKRLKDFSSVRFIEYGKDGKPTGKVISSTIDKMPELIRKYPVVKNILNLKKGELMHMRSISSSFFTEEYSHFLNILANVQDSLFFGTSQKELLNAVKKLENRINEFEKTEQFLIDTETKNLSPFQIFPYEFNAIKEHRNAAVPASFIENLKNVEKSYLQ